MGVKACRDQQQLRTKPVQLRQDASLKGGAKLFSVGSAIERLIDDIVGNAGLAARSGSGIKRHLMGGGIEEIGVGFKGGLCAVAVMDVEVDHGDALDAMFLASMLRGNRGTVEQAKAHGVVGFGMMSRRSYGAEDMPGLPRNQPIHRINGGTGSTQSRLSRLRRNTGIGIQGNLSLLGNPLHDALHHRFGMHEADVLRLGAGRIKTGDVGERVKRTQHRFQPRRSLRMPPRHPMLAARRMRKHNRLHAAIIQASMTALQKRIAAPLLAASTEAIERAARALAHDRLVAFPTETVYGLGAAAASDIAVAGLFAVKQRPTFNPLIIHVSDIEDAFALGVETPTARRLAERFWPGGLSLVIRKRADAPVSALASAGLETLALRVPAHPVAQKLLHAFGGAIAAPSANPSGRLSPTQAEHVVDALGESEDIDCILDGGAASLGLESTVIACPETGGAILLRPGSIPREDIEVVLDAPLQEVSPNESSGMAAGSPGRLARHYAPRASLRLQARDAHPEELLLAFGSAIPNSARMSLNLSEKGCLREAAANLFSHLARLDSEAARIGGEITIAVMEIPEQGLGRAINDRLRRGACR